MTFFPPFILYLGWEQSAVKGTPAVPSNVIHLKEKMIKKVRVKIRSLKNSLLVGIYTSSETSSKSLQFHFSVPFSGTTLAF